MWNDGSGHTYVREESREEKEVERREWRKMREKRAGFGEGFEEKVDMVAASLV